MSESPSPRSRDMAHRVEATVNRSPKPTQPMAHPDKGPVREWLRTHPGLRNAFLAGSIVLTGASGGIHHATGVDVTGPVGIGAAVDNAGSTIVDNLVKSSNSVVKDQQNEIKAQKEAVDFLFKPVGFHDGGQIEIDISKLGDARTAEMLLAARLGNDFSKIDPKTITMINGALVQLDSKIEIDNPMTYGQGMLESYGFSITTDSGNFKVLLPGDSVTVTKPGELKQLSSITDETPLDVTHTVAPQQ